MFYILTSAGGGRLPALPTCASAALPEASGPDAIALGEYDTFGTVRHLARCRKNVPRDAAGEIEPIVGRRAYQRMLLFSGGRKFRYRFAIAPMMEWSESACKSMR